MLTSGGGCLLLVGWCMMDGTRMTRVGWICSDLEVYGFIEEWYADFKDGHD